MKIKYQSHRVLAILVTLLTLTSLLVPVSAGSLAPTQEFPLGVTVDGHLYIFATHTSSIEGNWIELYNGTSIDLPQITLEYTGDPDANYTKEGVVEIDTNDTFIGDSITYPLDTHQIYHMGDTPYFTIHGDPSLANMTVDARLVKVNNPQDYVDALSDLWRGNNTKFESLIDSPIVNWNGTFDANGDFSQTFGGPAAPGLEGDYILLAMHEQDPNTTWLYAATIVEVLDGKLSSIVPAEVDEGDYLEIDMNLTAGGTGSHIFGALLVKESAYKASAVMTTDRTVPGTKVTVNGAEVIYGDATGFGLFGGGLSDLETSDVTDFMSNAFSGNEWVFSFSSSASNTTSLPVDTDGLSEGNYVVLTGIWDTNQTVYYGDRVLGFDQDMTYVDVTTFLPPIVPPPPAEEEPPTPEEVQELADEEAAEALEVLDDADAADIVDELTDDKAASVVQKMNTTKASKVLERVNTSKASKIIEQSDNETAAKIMDGIQNDKKNADILGNQTAAKAARVAEKMNSSKVAKAINSAPEKMDKFTDMANEMEEETAASVLLETEVGTGATLVQGMAEKDINKAARRVEAAVKRRLESADPETRERVMRKATEILENVNTDNLVDLFVEIANLPETPSTVADVFEEMNTTKVLDVITAWVNVGDLEELGLVFSYLTEDTLEILWTGMSADERIALYPELDGETIAALPQLGEFTVSDLSFSPETVEPGETVTITATVENIGEETDSTTLVVTVDGAEIATEIVTLEPEESTELTWTHSETTEGTYTVDVMGETVSFTVEAPPAPAEFTLSNLQVSPASVQAGEEVLVSFTVENTGELSGDYSIELMLDDESIRTLTGTLDGGESTTVETTVSSETEGTHTVTVDGLEAEFSVEAAPTGFPTTTIIAAVAIVIIAAVGYMYMQKQQ